MLQLSVLVCAARTWKLQIASTRFTSLAPCVMMVAAAFFGLLFGVEACQTISEQILDIPVPQMDQLVASLKHLDTPIPEQVTAVPKISLSSRRSRTVLREPQTAEQFVEVPAVVFLADCRAETTTRRLPARVPFVFSCHLSKQLHAVDNGCRQRHGSRSKAAATAQAVPVSRTPERRDGPGRIYAPHLKRSEEGQGRGGGSRDALWPRSGRILLPRRQVWSTSSLTAMSHLPQAPGRTGCLPCPDRRSGFSGTPWSRSR